MIAYDDHKRLEAPRVCNLPDRTEEIETLSHCLIARGRCESYLCNDGRWIETRVLAQSFVRRGLVPQKKRKVIAPRAGLEHRPP